jgi:hypothetical protein
MGINSFIKATVLLGVVFSSATVFAQDQSPPPPSPPQQQQQYAPPQQGGPRRPPEERAQRQVQWMQKNIGLTQDQYQKVFNILVNAARQQDEAAMNPPQRGEKKAIRRDEMGELQQVLNPDQFQRYMAHVKEMKERAQQRRSSMQEGY